MLCRADSPSVGSLIDSYRVGSWFEDDYEDEFGEDDYIEPTVRCEVCLCDIGEETASQKVYDYDGVHYCEDCFRDELIEELGYITDEEFNHYKDEYGTAVDLREV